MPITVTPLGVRCNLQCGYCYEEPQRSVGNFGSRYDLSAIKTAIVAASKGPEPFLLFGGEPLLLSKVVLTDLWSWGYQRSGRSALQTNGVLIDRDHVALFKAYKVAVGISIDGPGPLNDARWAGTLERTRSATSQTEAAIQLLCRHGLAPSLIVTLHRVNARGPALESLIDWFRALTTAGVTRIGIHLVEVENDRMRRKYQLTPQEGAYAILRLRALRRELQTVTFSLLDDIDALLLGSDSRVKCIWQSCDPYTTAAVRGIGGHGECTKCSRVNKEGIDFLHSGAVGYERYLSLYETPQEAGGCKDCRFFAMCRGQCPGTGASYDWRNKSDQCATWMAVFEAVEQELVAAGETPLSLSPLRKLIELELCKAWQNGRRQTVERILQETDKCATTVPSTDTGTAIGDRPPRDGSSSPHEPARLPFRLGPFLRIAWTSTDAFKVWHSQFRALQRALTKIECGAVAMGLRGAALVGVPDGDMAELALHLKASGLKWELLRHEAGNSIQELHQTWTVDGSRTAPLAVARPGTLRSFVSAIEGLDYMAVGDLMGYPSCCRASFSEECGRHGITDTVWVMSRKVEGGSAPVREVSVRGHSSTNILLRCIGIRAVPHLPCSVTCPATVEFATQIRSAMRGTSPECTAALKAIDSILGWPMEWSALHGIAEVKLPVLKMCMPTDATADKYVVRWLSDTYPEEGAVGLGFPYRGEWGTNLVTLTLGRL